MIEPVLQRLLLLALLVCFAAAVPAHADTLVSGRVLAGMTWTAEARVMFDATWTDTNQATSDRTRGRFALFLGARKQVNDRVAAAFRLATGVAANPVFPYTSFDNAAMGKTISIDRLLIDLAPLRNRPAVPESLQSLHVILGKQPLPFRYYPSFVWDPDLNLEGVTEALSGTRGRWGWRAGAGQFFFEDSAAPDDPYMLSEVIGIDRLPDTPGGSRGGVWAGLHHVIRPFAIDGTFQSNSNIPAALHTEASGFAVLELAGYAIGDLGFGSLRLSGAWCRNLAAAPTVVTGKREDDGWIADLTWGSATGPGTGEIGAGCRLLEADAVLGQFTDFLSTTAGATDAKSVFVHGAYVLWDDVTLTSTYFSGRSASARRSSPVQRLDVVLAVKL